MPTTLNEHARAGAALAQALAEATVYSTAPDHFTAGEGGRQIHAVSRSAVKRAALRRHRIASISAWWLPVGPTSACEAGLKLHDYAAVVPVLAGRRMGVDNRLERRGFDTGSAETANGCVLAAGDSRSHAAAISLLKT